MPLPLLHGACMVHVWHMQQGFGGKGANQAVMAAKLGASTAMVAKVRALHMCTDRPFGHGRVCLSTLPPCFVDAVRACCVLRVHV